MSKEAKTKKKSRRSQTEYPGLTKSVTRRVAREYLDQDYIDKLSPEEKRWLSNFNDEWLSANFKHSEGPVLHKTKKKRQEIYNRNNARNRDATSILKQRGHISNPRDITKVADEIAPKNQKNSVEDAVIALIDLSKESKVK